MSGIRVLPETWSFEQDKSAPAAPARPGGGSFSRADFIVSPETQRARDSVALSQVEEERADPANASDAEALDREAARYRERGVKPTDAPAPATPAQQPPKWSEIAATPKYQGLDDAGKKSVQESYWRDVLSPMVPTPELEQARKEFFDAANPSLLTRAARRLSSVARPKSNEATANTDALSSVDAMGNAAPAPMAAPDGNESGWAADAAEAIKGAALGAVDLVRKHGVKSLITGAPEKTVRITDGAMPDRPVSIEQRGAPITAETYAAVDAARKSAGPKELGEMLTRRDWVGSAARASQRASVELAQAPPAVQDLAVDGITATRRELMRQGASSDTADSVLASVLIGARDRMKAGMSDDDVQKWMGEQLSRPLARASKTPIDPGIASTAAASLFQATVGVARSATSIPEVLGRALGSVEKPFREAGTAAGRALGLPEWALKERFESPADLVKRLSKVPAAYGDWIRDQLDALSRGEDDSIALAFRAASGFSKAGDAAMDRAVEKRDFRGVRDVLSHPTAMVSFVAQAIPSLAVAAASGGSLKVMAALEGLGTATDARDFERRTGIRMSDAAFTNAVTQAAVINGFLEKIGFDGIRGATRFVRVPGAMVGEAMTEGGQQLNSNLAARLHYDPSQSLTEGVLPSMAGGAGAGVTGGIARSVGVPDPTDIDAVRARVAAEWRALNKKSVPNAAAQGAEAGPSSPAGSPPGAAAPPAESGDPMAGAVPADQVLGAPDGGGLLTPDEQARLDALTRKAEGYDIPMPPGEDGKPRPPVRVHAEYLSPEERAEWKALRARAEQGGQGEQPADPVPVPNDVGPGAGVPGEGEGGADGGGAGVAPAPEVGGGAQPPAAPQPDGATGVPGADLPPVPAGALTGPAGHEAVVTFDDGRKIPVRYRVVEADSIQTSHDDDLKPNPAYDQGKQNRRRDTLASQQQIENIQNAPDFDRLNAAPTPDAGAPMVNSNGEALNNGRTIGLRRAYARGTPGAQEYRRQLTMAASAFGIDPAQVEGMKAPILVREYDASQDTADIGAASNEGGSGTLSAAEQARTDASALGELGDFYPTEDGAIDTAANAGFIDRFKRGIPARDRETVFTADGRLSQLGALRLRNAVLAKAYGGTDILEGLTEDTEGVRTITNALLRAAPSLAELQDGIAAGRYHPVDIVPALAAAVREIAVLRAEGKSLENEIAQAQMFGPKWTEDVIDLMHLFEENKRAPNKIAQFLTDVADAIRAYGNPGQGDMLGASKPPSARDLVRQQLENLRKRDGQTNQPRLEPPAQTPQGESAGVPAPDRPGNGSSQGPADGGATPPASGGGGKKPRPGGSGGKNAGRPGGSGGGEAGGGQGDGGVKPPPKSPPKSPAGPASAPPAGYGDGNKLFTKEKADAARALLRKKLGQISANGPLDPEVIQAGIEIAGYHIEAGARAFSDFVQAMVSDLGDAVRPYLRSWYESIRWYPGFDNTGMTAAADITDDAADKRGEPAKETGVAQLPGLFLKELRDGRKFSGIVEARKWASERIGRPVESGMPVAKEVDEAIEQAIVARAREIVAEGKSPADTYAALVALYELQPNLSVRTSSSVANQAYSTPAPLAYVASQLAGITGETTVFEPTAGNGMLLIAADPANVTANELNEARAAALEAQGFTVSRGDAMAMGKVGPVDAVIANPPFGYVKDAEGRNKEWDTGRYKSNQVDHAISLKALGAMKDDGTAVLIIGAPNEASDAARSDAYNGAQKRAFFHQLYNEYNVVDHFTVDGKLYAKQGASWPVDVIVIQGLGKSALPLPAANVPPILTSWDQVGGKLDGSRASEKGNRPAGGAGTGPAGGNGLPGPNPPGGGSDPNNGQPPNGQPGGVRGGSSGTGGSGTGASGPVLPNQGGGATRGSGGAGGGADAPRSTPRVENTQHQVAYEPASGGNGMDTLVPVNMRDAVKAALDALQERVGNIDDWVAGELNYGPDELHRYFGAEQIDAIALAIQAIENGAGFIIGDQTGIGKGRVNAAMIRYAIEKGLTPIFVTEKPNLYKDLYRDLADIGMPEINPFMTNADQDIDLTDDGSKKIKADAGNKQRIAREMMGAGSLGKFDVIFTTYSQLQTVDGKLTWRHDFMRAFADGGMVILDESHNAGGTEQKGRGGKKPAGDAAEGRAGFVRGLVRMAKGVFYSSATFAKRPSVMSLYSATDMKLAVAGAIDKLADAIEKGGVPLQQVVSAMLAKAGQYIRRERSFAGIEYATTEAKVNRAVPEKGAEIMREITVFDRLKKDAVRNLKQEVKQEAQSITTDGSIGEAGVTSTNFTSIMHNMISQMLLALKAKPAAEMAIAALRRGEKPVLTVSNTMGSFIAQYVEDNDLKPGDAIDISFRDLMMRYLERSREVIIKDAYGNKRRHRLTDEELGYEARSQWEAVRRNIMAASELDSIPLSPLDYLKAEVVKAGFTYGEITGRSETVDYTGSRPVYRVRPASETTVKAKNRLIADYNSGKVDVILLNQSGSTGLSLHASERVADQRRRHMIIVQPEANIDTHMQMLGRINRTGQVSKDGKTPHADRPAVFGLPRYTQLVADVPAEKRPAAVLAKKMASLNANTTAARGSALTSKETVDFMNDYGDQVVARIMEDNPDVHSLLGDPLPSGENGGLSSENAIARVTGRIPMLTLKQQEDLYDLIESEYRSYYEEKERLGENALEAKTLELDAKVVDRKQVFDGHGGGSPFSEGAFAETLDVKKLGRPFTPDEVIERVASAVTLPPGMQPKIETLRRTAAAEQARVLEKLESDFRDYKRSVLDDMEDHRKREAMEARLDAQMERMRSLLTMFNAGRSVEFKPANSLVSDEGVVLEVTHKPGAKNPAAPSSWRWTIAIANATRVVSIPASRLYTETLAPDGAVPSGAYLLKTVPVGHDWRKAFENAQSSVREQRVMITGNLLAGYSQFQRGQIVNYTTADGEIRQGIFMPASFDLETALESQPVTFPDAATALTFLRKMDGKVPVTAADPDLLRVVTIAGGDLYTFVTKRAREVGGKVYLNQEVLDILRKAGYGEFVSSGTTMRVNDVDRRTAEAVLQVLMDEGIEVQAAGAKDEARQIIAAGRPAPLNDVARGERVDAAYAAYQASEAKRVSAVLELRKLARLLGQGKITEQQYIDRAHALWFKLEDKSVDTRKKESRTPLVRGPEWVEERLLRGARLGELDQAAVDLALWVLRGNRHLADGLAISVAKGGGHVVGSYEMISRVMTLMKSNTHSDTIVHEILHHTERMMPQEVQSAIAREWLQQVRQAITEAIQAGDTMRAFLLAKAPEATAGSVTAQAELKEAFKNGTLGYDDYQLLNPSEFWAVNASRILSARYNARHGGPGAQGWVAIARQWLREFLERIKGALGLKSDAPVLKALDVILKTDGTRGSGGRSIVEAAAHQAATSPFNNLNEPTPAQKEAGNYKKGHVTINGLDITIENPEGSRRRPEWPVMKSHYGYVKGTEGNDGDHVDLFIKPGTPPDYSGPVFVVDQVNKGGEFDEHKVMLGWPDEDSARRGYLANYTPGWDGLGDITRMSMDEFKAWLEHGDTTEPAADAFVPNLGLTAALKERGVPVASIMDAERRFDAGERIFVAHDMAEEMPREITSVEELKGYPADAILALPPDFGTLDSVARPRASLTPAERLANDITLTDRVLRAPFKLADAMGIRRLFDSGRGLLEKTGAWAANTSFGGKIAAGVISHYGLNPDYLDRATETWVNLQKFARATGSFVERLAMLDRGQSRIAYLWMQEKPDSREEEALMAALPRESRQTLIELKEMIAQLGAEAVRLGQLSADVYERNKLAYLHRSYLRHEAEKTVAANMGAAVNKKLWADQYKGRGIKDWVDMERVARNIPDWWDLKTQKAKADLQLRGRKFYRFERRDPVGEGVEALPGFESTPRRGKLREVVYWPADVPHPKKFDAWTLDGTWEARYMKGGKVGFWRDFTAAERAKMGEMDEVKFAIAKTLHLMAHDIEVGKMLEWVGGHYSLAKLEPGMKEVTPSESLGAAYGKNVWVRVPDTKVPGTNVARYGALAGRYVPGPIWNDIRQNAAMGRDDNDVMRAYQAVLNAWKVNKTALSPTVHANNVMANFFIADFHDLRARDLVHALEVALLKGRDEKFKRLYERFEDSGALYGMFRYHEIQSETIDPLLAELRKEAMGALQGEDENAAMTKALTVVSLLNKIGDAARYGRDKLVNAYSAEDEIFRLAMFLKGTRNGLPDAEAGKLARKAFLDYNINAPWIQALRKSVFPFIAFPYRALPMMMSTFYNKPWKLVKYVALGSVLNALAYAALGAGADEDRERALLPDEKAGKVWGLFPKLVRMPWNRNNAPVFLDVRRWFPMGDVWETQQNHAAVPMLPVMMPGGPLDLMFEVWKNQSGFTGQKITEDRDTAGERVQKTALYAWRAFMPNNPLVPWSYSQSGLIGAAGGGSGPLGSYGLSGQGTDVFGRELSLPQAFWATMGVKLGTYPPEVLERNTKAQALGEIANVMRGVKKDQMDFRRGSISKAKLDEEQAEAREKIRAIQQRVDEKMRRARGEARP